MARKLKPNHFLFSCTRGNVYLANKEELLMFAISNPHFFGILSNCYLVGKRRYQYYDPLILISNGLPHIPLGSHIEIVLDPWWTTAIIIIKVCMAYPRHDQSHA
jgi:hypothetical protein